MSLLSPEPERPADREELRAWMIRRANERIAHAKAEANRAHAEGDFEGAALCRHSIGENERAIEKFKTS